MALKLLSVVGARPQFIKLAPMSRAIRANGIAEIIVHTGQHYDQGMSEVFFNELAIAEPDYNLGVGSGSHGQQTGAMLVKIEQVLMAEKPDWVMVYGDTNSTLAAALAACKLDIPVAHVEAGLRSFNRRMPEEINRVVTDHISTLLFCPTETAVKNLEREGITSGVHLVGDVMLDGLLQSQERAKANSTILDRLGLAERRFVLATIHRVDNADVPERLRTIMTALHQLAETETVVVPVHPRTRKALEELGFKLDLESKSNGKNHCSAAGLKGSNLHLTAPLGYLDMIRLSGSARVILTDSGGLQKEAFWLGTPCLTLRNETEWVETIESGANRLCPPDDAEAIVQQARETRSAIAVPGAQSTASTLCANILNQCKPKS